MLEATTVPTRPATAAETVGIAKHRLESEGLAAVPETVATLEALELAPAAATPVLMAIVAQLLAALKADPEAPAAYAAIAALPAPFASATFDLVLDAMFGDGPRDTRALNDIAVVTLAGLLSSAGAHEQAAVLLIEARTLGNRPGIAKASWVARCRWAGCDTALTAFLADPAAGFETCAAAQASVDAKPLDLTGHRARIQFRLADGKVDAARKAMGVALSLPVGDGDKMPLAPDLALLVAALIVRGELKLLQADRLRWALATAPAVTQAAATLVEQGAGTRFPFLDESEAAEAATLLRSFLDSAPGARHGAVTGFPLRDGKPHVDTVWLEITNHCNQKCTFCPDMFREDARTWLPLDQIKQLIDQLADTVSVGSMQLNAYGEPLLHPNIAEILAYIRERKLPFPTYFTSHGMTLVDKKLKQLSNNYPQGIAISLHNDSQQSYEATRSQKIGDYETLVSRVAALVRQMAYEAAPSHLRLYQMVSNGNVDMRVDEVTRGAFPNTAERMIEHVRKWEAIAAAIVAEAPEGSKLTAHRNSDEAIRKAFTEATHADANHLPILSWKDSKRVTQYVFMSARPIGTYANLLLEYDPRWAVERKLVSSRTCGFTNVPSLAIFATGRLGVCCLDLNSTATFGALSDYADLHEALTSPEALRMFAQLSNGVTTSRGCQICLGGSERHCASQKLSGPARPAGHFPEGI